MSSPRSPSSGGVLASLIPPPSTPFVFQSTESSLPAGNASSPRLIRSSSVPNSSSKPFRRSASSPSEGYHPGGGGGEGSSTRHRDADLPSSSSKSSTLASPRERSMGRSPIRSATMLIPEIPEHERLDYNISSMFARSSSVAKGGSSGTSEGTPKAERDPDWVREYAARGRGLEAEEEEEEEEEEGGEKGREGGEGEGGGGSSSSSRRGTLGGGDDESSDTISSYSDNEGDDANSEEAMRRRKVAAQRRSRAELSSEAKRLVTKAIGLAPDHDLVSAGLSQTYETTLERVYKLTLARHPSYCETDSDEEEDGYGDEEEDEIDEDDDDDDDDDDEGEEVVDDLSSSSELMDRRNASYFPRAHSMNRFPGEASLQASGSGTKRLRDDRRARSLSVDVRKLSAKGGYGDIHSQRQHAISSSSSSSSSSGMFQGYAPSESFAAARDNFRASSSMQRREGGGGMDGGGSYRSRSHAPGSSSSSSRLAGGDAFHSPLSSKLGGGGGGQGGVILFYYTPCALAASEFALGRTSSVGYRS